MRCAIKCGNLYAQVIKIELWFDETKNGGLGGGAVGHTDDIYVLVASSDTTSKARSW